MSELEPSGRTAAVARYGQADYEVPDATAALIAEAVPANTALAYRSRWRSFGTWCAAAGRVALPVTREPDGHIGNDA